jgi:hypothetical protein
VSPPHPSTSRPGPPPLDRLDAALAAGVFLVALATRLRFLLLSPDRAWPHSAWFEGDAPLWARWAADLTAGREFERGLAIHSPAVAYLLRLLGCSDATADFTPIKAVWCALSALGIALAYLAFRLELPRRPAAIAAALLTFSFSSYVAATSLNGEALYTALLPLIVIGTVVLARASTPRRLFAAAAPLGIAHGLATLVRPEHTLLLAMLLVLTLWQRRRDFVRPVSALRTLSGLTLLLATSIVSCLPWAISTARATERFNTIPSPAPDYARALPPWTSDARAYLDSLPAFARADNFAMLNTIAPRKAITEISRSTVEAYFTGAFGFTPEPLSAWNLVSGQGPLCFALANHPQATGGFSTSALATPFSSDPELKFSYPPHLYLYNHGYRAGWDSIRANPKQWGTLVLRKLSIFGEGSAQGLTARNFPLGLEGTRRAVDQLTARSAATPFWQDALAILFLIGLMTAASRRIGAAWMLILASKLLITIAFYGYVRQAVSILPAFALFAALGLDTLLTLATPRGRQLPRWTPALWSISLAALVFADVTTSPPTLIPTPPQSTHPAPRWSPTAWESYSDITLTRAPTH